jgi:hypothetical protein
MNELEAARLVIGGYLQSGTVKDPAELRFLDGRLRQLEDRMAARKGKKADGTVMKSSKVSIIQQESDKIDPIPPKNQAYVA